VTRFLACAVLLLAVATANAATFTVTNTNDDGAGSLRDAVTQANAVPSSTINFSVTGTITLTSGQIQITGPLTITGPGAGVLTIDGSANGHIFLIIENNPPACPAPTGPTDYLVTISGLTLTNAHKNTDLPGGAIATVHSLALDSVTIRDSIARNGGGVGFFPQYPGQSLTITNAQFIDNIAKPLSVVTIGSSGGALIVAEHCTGAQTTPVTVTIANSLFTGNRVQPVALGGAGGAIDGLVALADITITDTRIVDNHIDVPSPPVAGKFYVGGGLIVKGKSVTIMRSEIANNAAGSAVADDTGGIGGGLGVYNDVSNLQAPGSALVFKLVDSTVSGNVANQRGGAMGIFGNVHAEILNSTVVGNSANISNLRAGGISILGVLGLTPPTLKLVSSIVAGNTVVDVGKLAADPNLPSPFTTDATNSLVQITCADCPVVGAGNLLGVDPLLAPLAFNGGSTRTHALLGGSPAINAGSNPQSLTTDQRGVGFPRAVNVAVDMGAYESLFPGAPTSVSATAGNAKATVTFTAPPSDIGSAITGYRVTSIPPGGVDSNADSTGTSHLVTGLVNGTAYTFTVTATNAAGTGPSSAASNSVTPKATTTTSLSAVPLNSSYDGNSVAFTATVNGIAPTGSVSFTDNGASIGCDAVSVGSGSGNTRKAVCNTSNLGLGNHSITGSYGGNGSNATSSSAAFPYTVKVPTAPNPPIIGSVVPGNQSAAVSFAPPEDDGGRPITGYTVVVKPVGGLASNAGSLAANPLVIRLGSGSVHTGATVNTVPTGPVDLDAGSLATTHQVVGLTNGVAYTFEVIASNELGTSEPSPPSGGVTPRADTSTSLGSSRNPSLPGQSVTFTATVTGATLTGTVLFQDGATPLGGCAAVALTGTQAQCVNNSLALGSHSLTALYSGDALNASSLSPVLTQMVNPPVLDVDASLTVTQYDALTDGLLVIRYLFGLTGTALTNGALGGTATRTDPAAIKTYLDTIRPLLDIDGNDSADALTDGLLIIRYLFGLRGPALIAGALDPLATRATPAAIEAWLQTLVP